jgi:hypothetical protein
MSTVTAPPAGCPHESGKLFCGPCWAMLSEEQRHDVRTGVYALRDAAQRDAAEPPRTGYACRPHLAPVTWRGRGCRLCQGDKAARDRAQHAERRRRAQASRDRVQNGRDVAS